MGLREEIEAVSVSIATAKQEPFSGHPTARRIRGEWATAVRGEIEDDGYFVKGSAGNSRWADSVWVAVFDETVTESAMHGFYPVYLVSATGEDVFLSLNQGTTEILERVGRSRYREVLRDTAKRDLGLLAAADLSGFFSGPIDLNATTDLARGYEAGSIVAVKYSPGSIPSDAELGDDLRRMLTLYRSLIEGRDQVQDDGNDPLSPRLKSGLEARRYTWHRRAERSRGLAAAAKKAHGTTCQVTACSKDLVAIYGELAEGYIEAHHLTSFASLEGRPTDMDPVEDFAVVCPDCHRMLHRTAEPLSLSELSTRIESAHSD